MGLQKKECSNTPIHPLMTSSDFLVLITILLAIVSTAIANNKMIWIYKFSRFSIITYILIMIAINYFIFFPWYEQRGIYIERLMIKGSPMAATWGYILSLVFIFLLIFFLKYSRIPFVQQLLRIQLRNRSCAMGTCEPCQAGNRAALSRSLRVPWGRRARAGCCGNGHVVYSKVGVQSCQWSRFFMFSAPGGEARNVSGSLPQIPAEDV